MLTKQKNNSITLQMNNVNNHLTSAVNHQVSVVVSGISYINTLMMLDFNAVKEAHEFTFTDRIIHDAICTIYAKSKKENPTEYCEFTDLEVLKKCGFAKNTQNIKRIRDSINKMSSIRVSLDLSDEYSKKIYTNKDYSQLSPLFKKESCKIRTNLLHTDEISYKYRGEEKTMYRLLTKPVLLSYNEVWNNRRAVKIEKITGGGRLDDIQIGIMYYLIQRIRAYKMKKQQINKIKLSTLYDNINYYPTKTNLHRFLKRLDSILKNLVEKDEIQSYKFIKEKQKTVMFEFNCETNDASKKEQYFILNDNQVDDEQV